MWDQLFKSECHIFDYREHIILFDVERGIFFKISNLCKDILACNDGLTLNAYINKFSNQYEVTDIKTACHLLLDAHIFHNEPITQPATFSPPSRFEITNIDITLPSDKLPQKKLDSLYRQSILLLLKESGYLRECTLTIHLSSNATSTAPLHSIIKWGVREARRSYHKTLHVRLKTPAPTYKTDKHILQQIEPSTPNNLDIPAITTNSRQSHYTQKIRINKNKIIFSEAPILYEIEFDGDYSSLPKYIGTYLQRTDKQIHLRVPLLPTSPTTRNTICEEMLPPIFDALDNLAQFVKAHVLSGQKAWIGEFEDYISQIYNQGTAHYCCDAGIRSLFVDPQGICYVCAGLSGSPPFKFGDVWTGLNRDFQKQWIQNTHVDRVESCQTCWARYLCGGNCGYQSCIRLNNMDKPNDIMCQIIRHAYELAMGVCLELSQEAPELLAKRYQK